MKRLIKLLVCILLVVGTFNVNIYAARANFDLFIKYNGNVTHYRGSTDEESCQEINPVSGNKIDNLLIGFDSDIASFTVTPQIRLELNDFNMYSNGGIQINLNNYGSNSHSMTINSHINSFYDSDSDEYFAPSVIYSAQTLSLIGGGEDNSLIINYDVTENFYESIIPKDDETYACLYCEKFIFGDSHTFGSIILNDVTNKDLIDKLPNETQIPVPIYAFLGDAEKGASKINWSQLTINSYTAAIKAKIGFTVYYSPLTFTHLVSNKPYVGIECDHFPEEYDEKGRIPVFDQVKLIMKDEEYKRYSYDIVGFLIKEDSELDFKDCYLDINYDLTLSSFIKMGKIGQEETNDSTLIFNKTYADIAGKIYIHQGDIKFIDGSNMSISHAYTPVITTDSSNSKIEVNSDVSDCTVLFHTMGGIQGASWIDSHYSKQNIIGFDNATGSYDGWAKLSYEPDNPYKFPWVAIQKDCVVSFPETGESQTVKSFEGVGLPDPPEAPEEQYFDGWYFSSDWGSQGRWYSEYRYIEYEPVRFDMELTPKFLYIPVTQVSFSEYEVDYGYFDYNSRSEYNNKYYFYRGQRYAYKNNQCLYYSSNGTIYNNITKEEMTRVTIDVPASSDTYVFNGEFSISDNRFNFYPYMIVTIGDKVLNRITEDKVLNENSTCQIDDSYQGYYVNSDLDTVFIQLVEHVPELQFVDRIDLEYEEFDFDNINFDFQITEGFIPAGVLMMLSKGQDKKYLVQSIDGISEYYDIKNEEPVDKKDVEDFDTAVVLVGVMPEEYGLAYSPNLKVYANQNQIDEGYDMTQFVGIENVELITNISKDLELFMVDEYDYLLLYVQLYFSNIEEPIELTKVPLTLPTNNSEGNLPYYTDGKGNYFKDPKGEEPIDINDIKIAKISKEVSVGTYVNKDITILDNKTIKRPVTNNNYIFKSDADLEDFICVVVNDKEISSGFEVASGSTLIRFSDDFIKNNLKEGNNEIYIVSKNETAYGKFTVKTEEPVKPEEHHSGSSSNYSIPKTGIR